MKRLWVVLLAAVGSLSPAHAADILPTTKAPVLPPPVNCYASFWTWLDSTAADCPLSYGPFTLYATVDVGLGYESNGAGYNSNSNPGVADFITKQSTHGAQWLWTPNGLSQSIVGIKMSEQIGNGWSLIGTAETGFNPYAGVLAYAQKSQVQNNGKALILQNANADSSRSGQWDNSQGFIGLSNQTYGALTVGRVNTLSLDGVLSSDPMNGSYAFSPLGFSGFPAGFGDTEAARANTAVKYRLDFLNNYRVAGLWQWGGYDQGNGTAGLYQAQIGGDFTFPSGGVLSLDAIGSYGKDEVSVSTFTGTCALIKTGPFAGQTGCTSGIPMSYGNDDLTATLSNNTGFLLLGKYKWQNWTLYGSYEYLRQANPSDTYPNGFETIGRYGVPGTILNNKLFPTTWITYDAYTFNKVGNAFWTGAKYSVSEQLDLIGTFYYLGQNNYNFTTSSTGAATRAACTGTGVHISNSKCAGSTDYISFLIDYRPVKRVDLYAGVMVSNVYGGLAAGFVAVQTINPTAGLRIKF